MKKKLFALFIVAVLVVSFSNIAFAENVMKAAHGTPVIDGKMDDIWKDSPAQDIMYSTNEDNPFSGTCRVMWDKDYLYLLYEIKCSTYSIAGPSQEGKRTALKAGLILRTLKQAITQRKAAAI